MGGAVSLPPEFGEEVTVTPAHDAGESDQAWASYYRSGRARTNRGFGARLSNGVAFISVKTETYGRADRIPVAVYTCPWIHSNFQGEKNEKTDHNRH